MKKFIAIIAVFLIASCQNRNFKKVTSVKEGDKGDYDILVFIPLLSGDTAKRSFTWNKKLEINVNDSFWFYRQLKLGWAHLKEVKDTVGKDKNRIRKGYVYGIRKYDSLILHHY